MPTKLTILPAVGILSDSTGPNNPAEGYFVPYLGPDGSFRVRTHNGTDLVVPMGSAGVVLPLPTANGKMLYSLDGTAVWADPPTIPPAELPAGGSAGQILAKTSSGLAWIDAPSSSSGSGYTRNAQAVVKTGYYQTPPGAGTWYTVPGLSLTLTPSSTTAKVLLRLSLDCGSSGADRVVFVRLMRGSTQVAPPPAAGSRILTNGPVGWNAGNVEVATQVHQMTVDEPASTSAQTYSVQVMIDGRGGYVSVNGTGADTDNSLYGHRGTSCLFAEEF